MKVIVLAAGFATRLYPLTEHQAKPLLDIGGRPMLSRLLDSIVRLEGVTEIIVVGNRKFADQFAAWREAAEFTVPMRVLDDGSTDDTNKLGAVGDLKFALGEIDTGGEDLLVAAGDNLFEFDLRPYHARFKEVGAPLLLVREIPNLEDMRRYNEITLNEEGRVTRMREKPEAPESNLASICLYFFTPDVPARIDEYLTEGGNPDAPGYFVAWLVGQREVYAARFEDRWYDIGNRQTLDEARARYGDGTPTNQRGRRT